jgi:hypothetical protein
MQINAKSFLSEQSQSKKQTNYKNRKGKSLPFHEKKKNAQNPTSTMHTEIFQVLRLPYLLVDLIYMCVSHRDSKRVE